MEKIQFLLERRSGKVMEGCLSLTPLAQVTELSANGYWREDSEYLTAQHAAGAIGFEVRFGPDDKPYPKRGYHVFVDGLEFVDLGEMRTFFDLRMRDPIVLEVWPDGTDELREKHRLLPKPWDLYPSYERRGRTNT